MARFTLSDGSSMTPRTEVSLLISMSTDPHLRGADHRGALVKVQTSVVVARFAHALAIGERLFVKRGTDLVRVDAVSA